MSEVLSFINQKGGVGKTTSACAVTDILAAAGYKILFIDLDAQCNATNLFGLSGNTDICDFVKLFTEDCTVDEMKSFVVDPASENPPAHFGNIKIIPGDKRMLNEILAEIIPKTQNNFSTMLKFRKNLLLIKDDYDYVIIDNPPSRVLTTDISITATDKILLPANCDSFSFVAYNDLADTVKETNSRYMLQVTFGGMFITKVKKNTNLYKSLFRQYLDSLGNDFIPCAVSDSNIVNEANTCMMPLYSYDKQCSCVKDYVDILTHVGLIDKKHMLTLCKDWYGKKEKK